MDVSESEGRKQASGDKLISWPSVRSVRDVGVCIIYLMERLLWLVQTAAGNAHAVLITPPAGLNTHTGQHTASDYTLIFFSSYEIRLVQPPTPRPPKISCKNQNSPAEGLYHSLPLEKVQTDIPFNNSLCSSIREPTPASWAGKAWVVKPGFHCRPELSTTKRKSTMLFSASATMWFQTALSYRMCMYIFFHLQTRNSYIWNWLKPA